MPWKQYEKLIGDCRHLWTLTLTLQSVFPLFCWLCIQFLQESWPGRWCNIVALHWLSCPGQHSTVVCQHQQIFLEIIIWLHDVAGNISSQWQPECCSGGCSSLYSALLPAPCRRLLAHLCVLYNPPLGGREEGEDEEEGGRKVWDPQPTNMRSGDIYCIPTIIHMIVTL